MASVTEPLLSRACVVAWTRLLSHRARKGALWSDWRLGSGSLGTDVNGACRTTRGQTRQAHGANAARDRLSIDGRRRGPARGAAIFEGAGWTIPPSRYCGPDSASREV